MFYFKLNFIWLRNAILFSVLYFLSSISCFGQNSKIADSLIQIYESETNPNKNRLKLLEDISFNLPEPDLVLKYSQLLLSEAIAVDSINYIFGGYLQQGNAYEQKGNLSSALNSYFKAVDVLDKDINQKKLGLLYIAIAAVYDGMDNKQNVIQYYKNAIDIFNAEKDTLNYAIAIENLGDSYLEWAKPDAALILFNKSGPLFQKLKKKAYLAYNLGNKGLAFAQKGRPEVAEENISEAIDILDQIGDYRPITTYLTFMSDIYADKEDWDSAFDYSLRSLDLAKEYGLKAEISNAYLKLSELYETTGYSAAALNYFRRYITFRDSVINISAVQQNADIRRNFEISQKQTELDLANQQKHTQKIIAITTATALFFILLLALSLYKQNTFTKRANGIIEREMARSESLLINILPEETAKELKEYGKVKAKKFESVTVLFTDFEAFTAQSEHTDPELLVNRLGYYFAAFDDIIEKYGLEKIKTIGDSYMCAGGLPFPTTDHPLKMIYAAFDILNFVEDAKKDNDADISFSVRIGINTGPVVAGVVGSKKFSYDIWGDTVNVASRMESKSNSGRINISENTYQLVKEDFECEYRGKMEVKNRGSMKMYFVHGANKKA